jgi:hypothetical protein
MCIMEKKYILSVLTIIQKQYMGEWKFQPIFDRSDMRTCNEPPVRVPITHPMN